MALEMSLTFRGCTVSLTNHSNDVYVNVGIQILEHLTGDELLEFFEWFKMNRRELRTVLSWQEYEGAPQWREKFTDEQLNVVMTSEFSKPDDRAQAQAIMERRRRVFRVEGDKKPQHGYIYLMKSSSGHYKIGASINPESRLKSISTASPFAVSLIHVIAASDMFEGEKVLHTRYGSKRVNNEWFELSEHDVSVIVGLRSYSSGRFL